MHRVRHLSVPSVAQRVPAPACAGARRTTRLASPWLLCALLCAPWPAAAIDDIPNFKPASLGRGRDAAPSVAPASGGVRAAEPAASAVHVDPIETLRRRLAERLAGGATVLAAGSRGEVRVVAHAPAGRARETPAAQPPARLARRADKPRVEPTPAPPPVPWSYRGAGGPQGWGELKPEFALCKSGQRQSPIDIRGGLAVDLEPVKFNYQDSPFGVIDNGHTVQANVGAGNTIELLGRRFELLQLHFHRPSEERIDGRQFEMSMHMLHKDAQGRLAMVAVLFDRGPAQPVVQKVLNNLPLEKGQELAARVPLDPMELLPTDRRYYTYMGSLTTPPCSEGVQWVVMRQPVSLSPEQIELFERIHPENARPLQEASGRRILQSQ